MATLEKNDSWTWEDPDEIEKNKVDDQTIRACFQSKSILGTGDNKLRTTARSGQVLAQEEQAALRIDTSTPPPQTIQSFKNSPTYVKKGGVLIPEDRYRGSDDEFFLSSLEDENAYKHTLQQRREMPVYERQQQGQSRGHQRRQEPRDSSRAGLLDSFLATLNPLEWMEWHYEYCNGPARRRSTLRAKEESVSLSNPAAMLPCVHRS